jgi:hypothetical protein
LHDDALLPSSSGFKAIPLIDDRIPNELKEFIGEKKDIWCFSFQLMQSPLSSSEGTWTSFILFCEKVFKSYFFSKGKLPTESILVLHSSPFKIELYRDGGLLVSLNERNLLHYEHEVSQDQLACLYCMILLHLCEQMEDLNEDAMAASLTLTDEERHSGKKVVDYGEDGAHIFRLSFTIPYY